MKTFFLVILLNIYFLSPLFAANWSSTNVQLLAGSQYQDGGAAFGNSLDDKEKLIVSFEHVSGWEYGDNFFFIDISNPTASGTNYYAEYSPRLSFKHLSGKELEIPFVKDLLLAMGAEWGNDLRSYLLGAGVSFDLPGFSVADLNFYTRKSYMGKLGADMGYQLTAVWLVPIELGKFHFTFEGFADYAFGENAGSYRKEDNFIAAPRFLVDIGHFVGATGKVQAGLEYQVWRNKYGIKDVNENVGQLMVKWIF